MLQGFTVACDTSGACQRYINGLSLDGMDEINRSPRPEQPECSETGPRDSRSCACYNMEGYACLVDPERAAQGWEGPDIPDWLAGQVQAIAADQWRSSITSLVVPA